MAYMVGGTVLDGAGNPANAMIAVYDRASGVLIGRCDSNISLGGKWALNTPDDKAVFVVRFNAPVLADAEAVPFVYSPGAPTGNAEIYDNVIPVIDTTGPAPL